MEAEERLEFTKVKALIVISWHQLHAFSCKPSNKKEKQKENDALNKIGKVKG